MQLDENDDPLICTIWGAKLLSVLQIVVLGVPSCALALVTMILCPCFMPGCGRNMRERGECRHIDKLLMFPVVKPP